MMILERLGKIQSESKCEKKDRAENAKILDDSCETCTNSDPCDWLVIPEMLNSHPKAIGT